MKTDYTFEQLKAGIKSTDITWGRDNYPQRFEFPALLRFQDLLCGAEPTKEAFSLKFPGGFMVKMTTKSYFTLEVLPL